MISPSTTPGYGSSNIISIRGGLDGAKNYPVTPGYTAWLLDEENKTFFIKSIGANGVPNIREFEFKEKENPNMQASGEDPSKYATKEDLESLRQEIRKLYSSKPRINYKHNNYRRNGNEKSYGKSV